MKKRFKIITSILTLAILASIVLQSVHSYHHLIELSKEKICHHDYKSPSEITHQHHHFDHCFTCEFAFAHYIPTDIQSFDFLKPLVTTKYTASYSREITQFFRGSLFSHRGPPAFIG